jgi:predicted metal-dependent peptidase
MSGYVNEALAIIRLRAAHERPYLSSALWALIPIEKPGLGTFAVDAGMRMYYDPAVLERWTPEEAANVLVHEVHHLLREHHERARGMNAENPYIWNLAGDAEINDDLVEEGMKLPDGGGVQPSQFGMDNGKFAEEYYDNLMKRVVKKCICCGSSGNQQGQNGQSGQQQSGSSSGGKQGTPQSGQSGSGSQPQSAGGSGASSGQGSNKQKGGKGGGGGKGDPNGPIELPTVCNDCAKDIQNQVQQGQGQGQGNGPADAPNVPKGMCGSCATGTRNPWEDPLPGEAGHEPGKSPDAVGETEKDLIRREVARQIIQESTTRGNIPAGLRRWAEEKLKPKVDYMKVIRDAVRFGIAQVSGKDDYTYRRPSRRQSVFGNIIMPSMFKYVPRIGICIDTSGSMSDTMISQSVAEVSGVLRALNHKEVYVVSCDASASEAQKVVSAKQVELIGGGGTDIGLGIAKLQEIKPKLDLMIIFTDCYTPWPATPPDPTKVIIIRTAGGEPPSWPCRVINVECGQ